MELDIGKIERTLDTIGLFIGLVIVGLIGLGLVLALLGWIMSAMVNCINKRRGRGQGQSSSSHNDDSTSRDGSAGWDDETTDDGTAASTDCMPLPTYGGWHDDEAGIGFREEMELALRMPFACHQRP